jgi:hypothetical protein
MSRAIVSRRPIGQGIDNDPRCHFAQVVDTNRSADNLGDFLFQLHRGEPLPLADAQEVLDLLIGGRLDLLAVAITVLRRWSLLRFFGPVGPLGAIGPVAIPIDRHLLPGLFVMAGNRRLALRSVDLLAQNLFG